MNYALVIESSGQRNVHKIYLPNSSSIIVGRAWQSDVIVNDEYVDARHIKISSCSEGQLSIQDLNTRNGTRLERAEVVANTTYPGGSVITLGETSVTIHDADMDVAVALARDAVHSANRTFGSATWVLIASVLASLAALVNAYWIVTSEVNNETLAIQFLATGAMFCIWCISAGIISKLFRSNLFGKLHWVFISLMFTIEIFTRLLVDIFRFNFDSNYSEVLLTSIALVVPLGLLIYGALSLCTRLKCSNKLASTFALILLTLAFKHVTPMLADEHELWTANANMTRVNQPPVLFISEPTTLEKHLLKTSSLFTKLDLVVRSTTIAVPKKLESIEKYQSPVASLNILF